ncbi:hypothetical protein BSNT_07492 [Bacillus subtilis subsp. natto BEST195]|nr:hypothetical protein BSNT_07492 [Bacillus subtilis subsp. natto BEST195]
MFLLSYRFVTDETIELNYTRLVTENQRLIPF